MQPRRRRRVSRLVHCQALSAGAAETLDELVEASLNLGGFDRALNARTIVAQLSL